MPDQQHGHDGGEVFRAHESPSSRQPAIAVSATVAAYWPTTTQASAARRSRSARPAAAAALAARGPKAWWTRATAPPGMQERPALDVDGADERADNRGGEHEPRGGVARATIAAAPATKNAPTPELCDRQRGRLPHRHERQQRRRGQNDPYLTSGPILEWDGHRVEEPRRMIARTPTRRGSRIRVPGHYRFATTDHDRLARPRSTPLAGRRRLSVLARASRR